MMQSRHHEHEGAAPAVGQERNHHDPHPYHVSTFPLERNSSTAWSRRASTASRPDYDVPDNYANLGEAADISPVQNPHEEPIHRYRSLEQVRTEEQEVAKERRRQSLIEAAQPAEQRLEKPKHEISRLATQLYTISYLILFSIFGTLARLGLQALTTYPGTPLNFPSIWPNFAGSLIMGFLAEDRMLFREASPPQAPSDEEINTTTTTDANTDIVLPSSPKPVSSSSSPRNKKTIPLYIGLATGFCGSLTSFSAFIRDTFLALANDLPSSSLDTPPREKGYSLLAVLAIPTITLSLSLSALFLGAHLAIFFSSILIPYLSSTPHRRMRTFLDLLAVPLAAGCWLGAVFLSIFPPAGHTAWRGQVTLALVFAPLGCLARFYAGLWLNGRVARFPVGTFVVNVLGTGLLAMAWDLAHVNLQNGGGRVVACQVLVGGVQDGFCGCLTTVSTWVAELSTLRRRHAYVYGVTSVLAALGVIAAVAGGVRWGGGFDPAVCR